MGKVLPREQQPAAVSREAGAAGGAQTLGQQPMERNYLLLGP